MQRITPFTKKQIEKCNKIVVKTDRPMANVIAQLTLRIDELQKAVLEIQRMIK